MSGWADLNSTRLFSENALCRKGDLLKCRRCTLAARAQPLLKSAEIRQIPSPLQLSLPACPHERRQAIGEPRRHAGTFSRRYRGQGGAASSAEGQTYWRTTG